MGFKILRYNLFHVWVKFWSNFYLSMFTVLRMEASCRENVDTFTHIVPTGWSKFYIIYSFWRDVSATPSFFDAITKNSIADFNKVL